MGFHFVIFFWSVRAPRSELNNLEIAFREQST